MKIATSFVVAFASLAACAPIVAKVSPAFRLSHTQYNH